MSQYMDFFLKINGSTYCALSTYSRCSRVYNLFDDALNIPYEKSRPISSEELNSVIFHAEEEKKRIKKRIKEYRSEIESISNMANNSVEEKMEFIRDIEESIDDCEDLYEEVMYAIGTIYSLNEILLEAKYDSKRNEDDTLFVGIECENPGATNDEDDY